MTKIYSLDKKESNVITPLGVKASTGDFFSYLKEDKSKLIFAFIFIFMNSTANTVSPFLVSKAIDRYISVGNVDGLLNIILILAGVATITIATGYAQSMLIGRISQRTLYRLKEGLFAKLQSLPTAFFNQNKAGDLMSRINNDTDKINQFLSQWIGQFIGVMFSLFGVVCFSLYLNWKLSLVMMSMVIFIYIITLLFSPKIRKENKKNLEANSDFSAALQENLTNFRVVAAYSKRDYLENHLEKKNNATFKSALRSGFANRIFEPSYEFFGAIALILVLSYGFHLISIGGATVGVLIAFVAYTQRFYDPMKTLATAFGAIQLASAAWVRLQEVLSLENNLKTENQKGDESGKPKLRLELKNVSFSYDDKNMVIENANLSFEPGKTYALVGPTGGGKSTLASIMAHLYDPTLGVVYLNGKDITIYSQEETSKEISVILQDPILFTGTVAENILYANTDFTNVSIDDLNRVLEHKGFKDVIKRFENGLSTTIKQNGAGLSIGQKQLISFMRAILREPKLLILDEATANIDTVTEAILNKTLEALPPETTKIIIAHRLNTIKDADEIMFVNGRHVTPAGSYEQAIRMITDAKRNS
ncbi:ABC transporter ATP-binding protein [Arenimonas sp.]|nr:ABC transporter ATP-binding protein [Candidatus Parcubacteria bacterium]